MGTFVLNFDLMMEGLEAILISEKVFMQHVNIAEKKSVFIKHTADRSVLLAKAVVLAKKTEFLQNRGQTEMSRFQEGARDLGMHYPTGIA